MKRIICFLIICSLCFFGFDFKTNAAIEKASDVMAYLDVQEGANHTIDVTLIICPQYQMDVLGMEFEIQYDYNYGHSVYPFTLDTESLNPHTDFSNAIVVRNAIFAGTYNYYWDSGYPVTLQAGETISLITFSLNISESASEGEYIFSLICNDFYQSLHVDDETIDIVGARVDTSSAENNYWHGERLEASCTSLSVTKSGVQDLPYSIFFNKSINETLCYIGDSSVAEYQIIENTGGGSLISVIGRKVGTTMLHIVGGIEDCESLIIPIHVTEPTPYMMSISKLPVTTSYELGDALDLTGLELRVEYNNYDISYITSGYTVGDYDFSTAGTKHIKISYNDLYVYIEVNVQESSEPPQIDPEPPTSIMVGDVNKDNSVTDADAVHLLYYTFFPEDYPVNQDCDFNGDGAVTDADAVHLLYYTFFPEDYPLN